MAESFETLVKSDKQPTRKTARLTPEQALEIVEASLREYQKAGGNVQIVPEMYFNGERMLAVILPGVKYEGSFVPVMAQDTGTGG